MLRENTFPNCRGDYFFTAYCMNHDTQPITVVLRALNKVSGTNSNFVVNMPTTLPSSSQNYSVKLLSAVLPSYNSTTIATTTTRTYITGAMEIHADFGGRTHFFDSNSSNLALVGCLANENAHPFDGLYKSQVLLGENPTNIVSNVKHQIHVQILDDDGEFLQTTLIASPYTKFDIEPIVLVFEFRAL